MWVKNNKLESVFSLQRCKMFVLDCFSDWVINSLSLSFGYLYAVFT